MEKTKYIIKRNNKKSGDELDIDAVDDSVEITQKIDTKDASIKKNMEQITFPHIFFNETELFLESVSKLKEKSVEKLFSIIYENRGLKSPYNQEDFKITMGELKKDRKSVV